MKCERPADTDDASTYLGSPSTAFVLDGQTLEAPCTSFDFCVIDYSHSRELCQSRLLRSSCCWRCCSPFDEPAVTRLLPPPPIGRGKRQNLMAQMAYAVIMLLSAGLVAGQSNSCLSAGTSLVSSCSAFTSTLLSDKGLATADDNTLKSTTDQETQKNGLPTAACCTAIKTFSSGKTNCACDPTIAAYAEGQYQLGSTAATEQALITTSRVGTYACTTTAKNGKPVAGTGTLPPASSCGGSGPPTSPPPAKTAG